MALTVAANPLLAHPALRALVDVDWESSFPLTLPASLGAPLGTYSTADCYPGGALGTALYEARLVEVPQVHLAARDILSAGSALSAITVRLSNSDGALTAWAAQEVRGKRVRLHLWDAETGTVQESLFVGEIASAAWTLRAVTLTVVAEDVWRWTDTFPPTRITTAEAPYAPRDPGPTGGLGQCVPFGIGVGQNIPCRQVRTRDDEDTRRTVAFAAATTDTCTSVGHGLVTGDGPFVATSTGTLPGGLAVGTPYWVVRTDADTFRLATTPANAQAATVVDITSTGSGTHTLSMGRAPQPNDEYDYVIGMGSVRIERLQVGNEPPAVRMIGAADGDYAVLPTTYRWNGRYATAVRLHSDRWAQGARPPVVADVQRITPDLDPWVIEEWWWQDSFEGRLGRYEAVPTGGLSTADLVAGPTGIGRGAVTMDVTLGHKVAIPRAPFRFGGTPFTIECWVRLTSVGSLLIAGPDWMGTMGYTIETGSDGSLSWTLTTSGGGQRSYTTAPGAIRHGRWHYVAAVRDPINNDHTLYLDGQRRGAATGDSGAIAYDIFAYPMTLELRGDLGWTRISGCVRTTEEIAHTYGLMRRNPVAFAREVLAACGAPMDEAIAGDVLHDIDEVEDGALKCDGWITEETSGQAVLDAFAPFRSLRFERTTAGLLAARIHAPATTVEAQFGTGDTAWANLVSVDEYRGGSLAEAIRRLPLLYRPARGADGQLAGYQHETVADVLPVGAVAQPLALPFVWDHVTADVIRSYLGPLLASRDRGLRVTAGHEARTLRPGQVVRLEIPALGLAGADYTVAAALHLIRAAQLDLVPYSEAPFTYVPGPMPVDAPPRAQWTLGEGMTWALSASVISGRTIKLALDLTTTLTLRPAEAASVSQWPTVVGATTHAAAVDEASADDDTSYVGMGFGWLTDLFRVPDFTAPAGALRAVTVTLRARTASAATAFIAPRISLASNAPWSALTTSYAAYATTWTKPDGAGAWTAAQVREMTWGMMGLQTGGDVSLRVTQATLALLFALVAPDDLAFVRCYRVGPSATQPPTPEEHSDAIVWPTLSLPEQRLPDGSAGEKYWWWVRVYDQLHRMVALVGPASVTVS